MKIGSDEYRKVYFKIGCQVYDGKIPATKELDVIGFALEKQIPKYVVKSPKFNGDRCPVCNDVVYRSAHYCKQCGQKLDWRKPVWED